MTNWYEMAQNAAPGDEDKPYYEKMAALAALSPSEWAFVIVFEDYRHGYGQVWTQPLANCVNEDSLWDEETELEPDIVKEIAASVGVKTSGTAECMVSIDPVTRDELMRVRQAFLDRGYVERVDQAPDPSFEVITG